MNHDRRKILASALGALGLLGSSKVFSTVEEVEFAIESIVGDSDVTQGAVILTVPEIAENGHSVSLRVSADSYTTDNTYVESIAVFADGNPNPEVITFNFSENSGEAFVATRMRLAQTQNVIAVAKLSDGSFFSDSKFVNVTIGGCGA